MVRLPRTKVSETITPRGHVIRQFDGPFFVATMFICSDKIIVQHGDKRDGGGYCQKAQFFSLGEEDRAYRHCRAFARRHV